jgi:hypothetical protein
VIEIIGKETRDRKVSMELTGKMRLAGFGVLQQRRA